MIMGDRIKERMAARGISQSELARRVGIKQPSVHALLKDNKRGSAHLHKIARELGTTAAYLAGETDDPDADAPPAPSLSHDEDRLLAIYRALPQKDQAALKHLIERMADE